MLWNILRCEFVSSPGVNEKEATASETFLVEYEGLEEFRTCPHMLYTMRQESLSVRTSSYTGWL